VECAHGYARPRTVLNRAGQASTTDESTDPSNPRVIPVTRCFEGSTFTR
jgi:hypothetical protein